MGDNKQKNNDARKIANANYDKKAYDKILLRLRAGRKKELEEHAAIYQLEVGEIGKAGYSPPGSLQGFITRAINEQIKRDLEGSQSKEAAMKTISPS